MAAQEAIYSDASGPMVNWKALNLRKALESAGLVVEVDEERSQTEMHIDLNAIALNFKPVGDEVRDLSIPAQYLLY